MKKKQLFALVFIAIAMIFLLIPFNKKEQPYTTNQGKVFGTFYNIIYQQPQGKNLNDSIIKTFQEFDASLSTFNQTSTISKINRNKSDSTDYFFRKMYEEAQRVSSLTNGAFDITVAPLVNAWGFGFKQEVFPTQTTIDSILQYVGYKKISLKNNFLQKQDSRIQIDASAIAKGFSVDIVANLLEKNGCENFLVDIGGEIVAKGKNPKGEKWTIGINKPTESPIQTGEIQSVLYSNDIAMATSGNYRQFYYKDGKKYAHTIDPKTGQPVQHQLLSATIVAPTCMTADAFATACMVMGTEKSIALCDSIAEIEGFFIYSGGDSLFSVCSKGFEKLLKK
ncbi:MAG: FAD:protein FMN transferase [Paludibacteraceae bacterium]|nr:FAD:protein FMN transferase [Paludibacteraceae bacterium]